MKPASPTIWTSACNGKKNRHFEPPKVGKPFPVLVPQSDADGNDLGGVSLPELQVPLATYTGWNLRDPSIGASDLRLSFYGSFIPLAKTTAEREIGRPAALHCGAVRLARRVPGNSRNNQS
jgi:hypothetical protein